MSLRFGDFELDRERRQLLRSGRPLSLEPKAYELLSLLVERRPKAPSRAQIRDVVWPGVFISESTLGVAVNAIRQALGDDARQPRFIRTIHGFGYAFCGEASDERSRTGDAFLEADPGGREEDAGSAPPEPKQDVSAEWSPVRRDAARPPRRWRWPAVAVSALVLLSAGWYWLGADRTKAPDESPTVVPLTSLPGVELDPALSPDARHVAFPPAVGTTRSGRRGPMRRMGMPARSRSPGTVASRRKSHRMAASCTTPNAMCPASGSCP